MDDIFFTDNKNRNGRQRPSSKDRFSNETPIFTRDSRLKDDSLSDDKFVVHIPQEENDLFTPQSRTPKGRPVSSQGFQGSEAAESGSDIYSSAFPGRTPAGKRVGAPQPPTTERLNRTPSGQRLGGVQGVQKESAPPLEKAAVPLQKEAPPPRTEDLFSSGEIELPQKSDFAKRDTAKKEVQIQRYPSHSKPALPKQKSAVKANKGFSGGGKPSKKPTGRKKGKGAKIFLAVFLAVVILFGAVFAYGYSLLGKISYDAKSLDGNEYISDSKLTQSSDVRNILFMGSDARGEVSGQRSDTMILCSIDKKNKKLKLTSFLRDSYVFLPSGKYYNKLNATFSYGGVQYTVDTLEYNFKIKIDDYIIVDFEAFRKLVNMMGGLTIEGVTESEAKYMRDVVKIPYVKAGTNKFKGGAALWYCRIRYLDNDFKRTERQRKVISAMVSQLTKTSPTQLLKMMETILPMIQTNISRNELVSLGVGALVKYLHYDIIQHQVPADGTWNNRTVAGIGDVLEMDIDKNAALLKKFIYKSNKAVKAK